MLVAAKRRAHMDGLLAFSNELATAVEHAGRSVVGVNGRRRFGSTGVHWRAGLIVTADHTVEVDEDVTVTTPDGRTLAATVGGRDPAVDLAILKIDGGGLAVADVATESPRVGHIVLAVGRGPRASWGVISAIGHGRRELLSLDLTLYPGFSGGPLVDASGRVVGVTTSGSERHLQLAIPAATVDRLVDEVLRRGHLPRAYFGVGEALRRVTVEIMGDGGALGSGLLWPRGCVVTNAHVIRTARAAVRLVDGIRLDGRLVARNREADLAVLQLPGSGLPAATLADSAVRVGSVVVAVGH